MSSWLILGAFYWFAHQSTKIVAPITDFLWKFPLFLAVSMGLSLHNAIAVLEGYLGKKTPFVRTPKFNLSDTNKTWHTNIYNVKSMSNLTVLEGFLLLYFITTLIVAIQFFDFAIIPMVSFLVIGYSIVFFSSILHLKKGSKKSTLRTTYQT
jgi:hypothetical protein